jgi:hypothetical protein
MSFNKKAFRSVILITITILVGVFITLLLLTQDQVPPITVAEFKSGMEGSLGNGTRITEVFQITKEKWSIDLVTAESLPFWSFKIELYTYLGEQVLVMKGKMDFWSGRVVLEYVSGADGKFVVPYEYQPDLPPDSYYFKIYWTNMGWFIQVFEFEEAS